MNATNARNIGYEDGKTFIASFLAEHPGFTDAHKAIVLSSARNRAVYTYHVRSQRTADFYVLGAVEAWCACEKESQLEAEEAARRAAVPHNPASRFCTCVACMEG